jgi:hypothetical protein
MEPEFDLARGVSIFMEYDDWSFVDVFECQRLVQQYLATNLGSSFFVSHR